MKLKTILNIVFLGLGLLFRPLLFAGTPTEDYNTALTEYRQGNYEASLSLLQSVISADSSFWQAYQLIGNAELKTRHFPEAYDAYQKSLSINPDNPSVAEAVANLKSLLPASRLTITPTPWMATPTPEPIPNPTAVATLEPLGETPMTKPVRENIVRPFFM